MLTCQAHRDAVTNPLLNCVEKPFRPNVHHTRRFRGNSNHPTRNLLTRPQSLLFLPTTSPPLDQLPLTPCCPARRVLLQADQQQDVKTLQDVLHMDVQADDDDCMAQMGYMYEQHPHLQGCQLAVSPRVSSEVASESIKMLFMFGQLKRLQLRWVNIRNSLPLESEKHVQCTLMGAAADQQQQQHTAAVVKTSEACCG